METARKKTLMQVLHDLMTVYKNEELCRVRRGRSMSATETRHLVSVARRSVGDVPVLLSPHLLYNP